MKCKNQLNIGKRIELEHAHLFPKSQRNLMARKIASDHIKEYPCYYSKGSIPMEKRLMKGGKKWKN